MAKKAERTPKETPNRLAEDLKKNSEKVLSLLPTL
jgi:hypothetical protein